jgi:hypothetical protein
MESHGAWPRVQRYLGAPDSTPWGIVVEDYGRDFLLFLDARERLHVVEVTGHAIAGQIANARFRSPRFEVIGLP